MRLTLIDLVIAWVLGGGGAVAGQIVARRWLPASSDAVVTFVSASVAVAALFTLAPFVYRYFHLFPLFLPICPHCGTRPTGYWIRASPAWPRFRVKCPACEVETQLLLAPSRTIEGQGGEPLLLLRWPWFLGLWKRIR